MAMEIKTSIKTPLFIILSAGAILLQTMGGCTGDDDPAPGSDAGDGGLADDGSVSYTLDNICDALARGICSNREGCCTQQQLGFDLDGCATTAKVPCEKNVAEVRGGSMSFNPANVDGCLSSLAEWHRDHCTNNQADFPSQLPQLNLCHSIFMGKLEPGDSCERDEQCNEPTATNQVAFCNKDAKTCFIFTVLPDGGSCEVGPQATSMCDDGLYCDADLSSAPYVGTCKPATALGKSCDPNVVPAALECGVGFYCDNADGVCHTGKGAGEGCTHMSECMSISCVDGKCDELDSLVDEVRCNGK